MCQIIAGAAVEPHLGAVLAGDNPEAVVLDLRASQGGPDGGFGALVGRQRAMKPVGRARGAANQRLGSTSMEIVLD
jgi:hypothetical protein